MIIEKKVSLKSILESSEGIHLTAYLVNRGDLVDLKLQLQETLNEAYEWLYSVQSIEERKKFLEPLDALLNDARILKDMKGNIGIFRTKDSFRILNIPVDLERQCHVATTFHVKPLLRWMQLDREFLILGLTKDSAHLYIGNQSSLHKIDAILFPEFFRKKAVLQGYINLKKSRQLRLQKKETYSWTNGWLLQLTQKSSYKLFVAGEKPFVGDLIGHLKQKNIMTIPVSIDFDEHNLSEICRLVRHTLKDEAKRTLTQALLEFHFAEELNLAKKNIFQIAKAAVQGRVKKLIVADSINVFGKLDKKTGNIEIHPFDLDHEDDDILDDIAQAVLASGGEVLVAHREEIPKGRPILAILEHEDTKHEIIESNERLEFLSERATL